MRKHFQTLNGWQRLWIVVSTLYLIPVVAGVVIAFPEREQIESSWVYAAIEAVAEHRKATEPDFSWNGAYSVRNAFYKDMSNNEILLRLKKQWGEKVNLTSIESEYQQKLDSLPTERAEVIGIGILAWSIPIGLAYVIGLAVAWVIQGFRNKPR